MPEAPQYRILGRVLAHPHVSVLLGTTVALFCLALALWVLEFNFDENDLFDDSLSVVKERSRFYRQMPALADPIIVVLRTRASGASRTNTSREAVSDPGKGTSTASLLDLAARLAVELKSRPDRFEAVYGPVDKDFLQQHALLYLDSVQRQKLLRDIERAQPLLGRLSVAPGLETLFSMLEQLQLKHEISAMDSRLILRLQIEFTHVLEAWLGGRRAQFDWQALLPDPPASNAPAQLVLLVKPVVDYTLPDPAGEAVASLRALIERLNPGDSRSSVTQVGPDIDVAITGVPVLAHDDGVHVAAQAGLAGLASLLLVLLLLMRALRSWRALAALLFTLVVSICWTLGLASLTVGHLNVISVAFGVLSIGLGVDFSIHLLLRAQEELADQHASRVDPPRSLGRAVRLCGSPLLLCALTTASAFLSYLATPFTAMAELGLITAGGLLASMLGALLLLPAAMLSFGATSKSVVHGHGLPDWITAPSATRFRAFLTIAVFAGLTLAAALLAVQVRFDANPLNVRDPGASSVLTLRELLASNEGATWNMNVLVRGEQDRIALEQQLTPTVPRGSRQQQSRSTRGGPVKMVRGPETIVPLGQAEALEQIDETALTLLPGLDRLDTQALHRHRPDRIGVGERVRSLSHSLSAAGAPASSLSETAGRLREALNGLLEELQDPAIAQSRLDALHWDMMSGLIPLISQLRTMLSPGLIQPQSLPPALYGLAFAMDGRQRLEILPSEDLSMPKALHRFVDHVRRVAPDAFGEALVIDALGNLVMNSLKSAMLISLVAVLLLTWLWTGSLIDAAFIVVLTLVACLFTLAGSKLLDVPLNFANVIVLPLLLGIGVDTAIHLMHRVRQAPAVGHGLLGTSTARACFYSASTTLLSFGTLALATHLGLASLGTVLCLGVLAVLAVNLLLLPAILRVFRREG